MSLTLYTSVESACAQKVRLVLAGKKLQWQEITLNLRKGEQFQPEYLALNPKAVVPTLVHEGAAIIESSVINEYLDEVFPQPTLKPDDPLQRSQMRLWVKRQDEEVHPAIGVLTYALVLRHQMNELKTKSQLEAHFQQIADPKRRARQQQAHELGIEAPAVSESLNLLAAWVRVMDTLFAKQSWLAGDRFSLADAAWAPYMMRLKLLGLSKIWQNAEHFQAWLVRIEQLQSLQRIAHPWGSEAFNAMAQSYAKQEVGMLLSKLDNN